MNVLIVIATDAGRVAQAHRAHDAYLRETAGGPEVVQTIYSPHGCASLAEAWLIALESARGFGDVVHFTSDEIEPHPGWLPAALAAIAADRIPSPTLWSAEGVELNAGLRISGSRDWSSAVGSEYPTMSAQQIATFGPPPISDERGAQYVVRHDYSFTRHA